MEWRLFADLADVAGEREVTITLDDGATVDDALDALVASRPALRERVLDGSTVADHVSVLVNGTDVATGDGLDEPVADGDELALLPPVSGG
ncbi:ubiquitin-like small modifier protein 1 [Halococcoides cellulosivorans]|uniref:Molybdopterin synthase sulfur carrier subunit n=1 Tax=Halococcoides cellulosivorans TaxID=1679096 RepID=A0A2R4X166_9EURY|nr:ubiquitin-like small modifier protein 1 [Halococcoides cellulosivorans]AWB27542.1 molybdopterin synthase sulfur carrier subunit [Halococcoides cellulosivorans]